jgi:hypothetical protein
MPDNKGRYIVKRVLAILRRFVFLVPMQDLAEGSGRPGGAEAVRKMQQKVCF